MNLHAAQQSFDTVATSQLEDLKRDLSRAAQRYTGMRVEWRLTTSDERPQMNAARTRAHDALIDAFNTLSREQTKRGEGNSWRKTLGDMAAYFILLIALSVDGSALRT